MFWTRSETLALAQQSCTFCYGLGLRPGRLGVSSPCNCVFRSIFRACYAKYRGCASSEGYVTAVKPGFVGHCHWALPSATTHVRRAPQAPRRAYGMPKQEYAADFLLVSLRALAGNPLALAIFRLHFLRGEDWRACVRRLEAKGMCLDRGAFFHEVYRIQQKLGRSYRELTPHALYPLDEYFSPPRDEREPGLQPHPLFPVETEPARPAKPRLRFPLRPKLDPNDLPKHAPIRRLMQAAA